MHKKTAIVTGGGSGLGLAIAKQFIEKGINVVIVGRNSERLSDACKALGEFCSYEVCDLSDLNAIPSLINTVEGKKQSDRYLSK